MEFAPATYRFGFVKLFVTFFHFFKENQKSFLDFPIQANGFCFLRFLKFLFDLPRRLYIKSGMTIQIVIKGGKVIHAMAPNGKKIAVETIYLAQGKKEEKKRNESFLHSIGATHADVLK